MTIVSSLPFTLQNGTVADATQVMANLQGIVDDVNANAAANGANSDITSLLGLTTPLAYGVGGSSAYIGATSTGSANAQVVASLVPDGFTLTTGKRVIFVAGFTNTAAATLNAGGLGAKNIYKLTPAGPVALTGGEVVAGNVAEVVYDGTEYQLVSNLLLNLLGPLTDIASATTTDLGTLPSHNANITGTTTITAFGSSASLIYPIYLIKFAGILTLTHNGTSLIIPGAANITTAAGDTAIVEYLGSGNWRVRQYTRASGQGLLSVLKGVQAFTSGSGTYTPSTGATRAIAIVTGGGGGGGGVATTNSSLGGGGGAGATAFVYIASLASVSYTVGAGGTAGSSAGGTGGTGGQSALGTTTANGGTGGAGNTAGGAGAGGAGSSTTANATLAITGATGAGANLSALRTGEGAASFWGGGAPPLNEAGSSNGVTATVPGAGGSGASRAGSNQTGGVGGAGVILILEF